jgi:hypothetical protein
MQNETRALTLAEAKVVGEYFKLLASREGEDICGVLMKFGAFRYLHNEKLVEFSRKLEEFEKLEPLTHYEKYISAHLRNLRWADFKIPEYGIRFNVDEFIEKINSDPKFAKRWTT